MSRLLTALGNPSARSIAPQSDYKVPDGDEQIAVGVDSLIDMPTDILRRAKAGDPRIHVVEDSGASSSKP